MGVGEWSGSGCTWKVGKRLVVGGAGRRAGYH